MSARLSVVAVLVVALLALPGAAHSHAGSAAPNADGAAKRKAKRCKKGLVRVKVGRRVSCRRLKSAFPRPRQGDPRKLVVSYLLRKDWSNLRSRRGRRLPSLPKLIRKTGRKGPALLARATSQGLARLDGLDGAAAAASASSRAAPSASDCSALSQAPRRTDNFTTGGGGGPSATVGVTLGPDGASMGIGVSGNGYSVNVDMDMGLCDPNEVEAPACPTAVGKLEGEIRYKLKVVIQVKQGDTEVWSQGTEVTRRTKLVGWNEVDAKLDTLDVDDVETSNFTLGGSTRAHPPLHMRTKLVRRTQVDMRSGSYEPGESTVDITMNMDGLYGPDRDEAEADAERRARADSTQQFRAVVEKAISGYRFREEGWQQPTCADLKLTAAPNTLTLAGGASGTFTAAAIAKADGRQSELDARLSDQQHASFSPTRAGGQRAQFEYSNVVGSAPPGSKARAKVRATSKAGVVEGVWEQPIRPPFEINEIAGIFSGSFSAPVGPRTAQITWNGSATFLRQTPAGFPGAAGQYLLKAGVATFHYSGGNILAHAVCDMQGSSTVDLFQKGGGGLGVNPVDPLRLFERGPHDYGGDIGIGPDATVTLTMVNCIPQAASEEGKTYTIPIGQPPLETGDEQKRSPDGIHYNGSHSTSASGISTQWSWVMTGTMTTP